MTSGMRRAGDGSWRQTMPFPPCRACGYTGDALSGTGPEAPPEPSEGDFSVCFRCGEVEVIIIHPLLGVQTRPPTTDELAEFAQDPANVAAVRDLHRFNAAYPRD